MQSLKRSRHLNGRREQKRSDTTKIHLGQGCSVANFRRAKRSQPPRRDRLKSIPSMQTIAWKTGTSYGFRDAWAVGVTPRYAVGVWVGNATGEGKPGLVGAQTAGPVLFDVFNYLPSSSWFERPTGVFIDAEVCRQSGHLKGRFCERRTQCLYFPPDCERNPAHIITSLLYLPTRNIVFMRIVPIRSLLSKGHGSHCLLCGNGIINSIIRNTSLFLRSNQVAEKIVSNPCNSFILR